MEIFTRLSTLSFRQKQVLAAVKQKASTDVRGAYERYTFAVETVSHYSEELLRDADRVLEANCTVTIAAATLG
jgi:hypothetical protein